MIQGRDLLQLKIVKQQYRGSVKRASDLKMKTELYRVRLFTPYNWRLKIIGGELTRDFD